MGVKFDGVNDAYTLSSAGIGLNAGSFGAWVRNDLGPAEETAWYLFDTDTARHAFYHRNDNPWVQMYNDGVDVSYDVTGLWSAGDWTHFLFVYNKTGPVQTLYVDGVIPTLGDTGSGAWGNASLGTNLHIARRISDTEQLSGDIAEVFITTAVLTQSHATQLALGISPRLIVPNLVAYIPFLNTSTLANYYGVAPVEVGAPTETGHPRVIYPYKRPIFVPAAAAAGGNFLPYFNKRPDVLLRM